MTDQESDNCSFSGGSDFDIKGFDTHPGAPLYQELEPEPQDLIDAHVNLLNILTEKMEGLEAENARLVEALEEVVNFEKSIDIDRCNQTLIAKAIVMCKAALKQPSADNQD